MSTGARVESIDAIKEFRVYLTKFKENAGLALGDADSDLNKVQAWLEGEAQNYWTGQIRKRQELVSRCEEAYRQKRIYKDSSGSMASAVDEQKALANAKKSLTEAQEKLKNVQGWSRKLQKEMVLYRGGVARFSNDVSAGIPHAIAQLGAMIEMLEKYVSIAVGEVGEGGAEGAVAGVGGESGGARMSRSPDEMPVAEAKPFDVAALREALPKDEALGEPVPLGLVTLGVGEVKPEQRSRSAGLLVDEGAGDGETVILTGESAWADRIFMARMADGRKFAWFVGSVDAPGDTVYNKSTVSQLEAGRPDIAELLKLPAETVLIFDGSGLAGVYNSSNENILPPPAEEEGKKAS